VSRRSFHFRQRVSASEALSRWVVLVRVADMG
jgi:hypothetical protein